MKTDQSDLRKLLRYYKKDILPTLVADMVGFIDGNDITVAVSLQEGVQYEDIIEVDQMLMDLIVDKMSKRQRVELYWQLAR